MTGWAYDSCSFCRTLYSLRKDGTVRKHEHPNVSDPRRGLDIGDGVCPGSGKPPFRSKGGA